MSTAALIDDALARLDSGPEVRSEEMQRLARRLRSVREGLCADPACRLRCPVGCRQP